MSYHKEWKSSMGVRKISFSFIWRTFCPNFVYIISVVRVSLARRSLAYQVRLARVFLCTGLTFRKKPGKQVSHPKSLSSNKHDISKRNDSTHQNNRHGKIVSLVIPSQHNKSLWFTIFLLSRTQIKIFKMEKNSGVQAAQDERDHEKTEETDREMTMGSFLREVDKTDAEKGKTAQELSLIHI